MNIPILVLIILISCSTASYCYVANIISNCTVNMGSIIIYPTNGTIIWYDGSNYTSTCVPTINEIEYLSVGLIEILGSIYGISLLVGTLIILIMSCYIISVWIERKTRRSRNVFMQIDY